MFIRKCWNKNRTMEFTRESSRPSIEPVSLPDTGDPSSSTEELCDERKLWIGNIERTVPEFLLLKIVQEFGELEKFDFTYKTTGLDKGTPRGYCFVTYKYTSSTTAAIKKLNGYILKGRPLRVKLSERKLPAKTEVPQPSGKAAQIAAIEEKLKRMEKEEASSVKDKLVASAAPCPLMRLVVKRPSHSNSTLKTKHKKYSS
ncbi:probable RNA-binding protein 18 [Watersipora subatra]|uniref:probable RNA-binding protein 18 n=1 Tax=Watersipora subatra TaxID=2589382 RepID=UPI00355BA176